MAVLCNDARLPPPLNGMLIRRSWWCLQMCGIGVSHIGKQPPVPNSSRPPHCSSSTCSLLVWLTLYLDAVLLNLHQRVCTMCHQIGRYSGHSLLLHRVFFAMTFSSFFVIPLTFLLYYSTGYADHGLPSASTISVFFFCYCLPLMLLSRIGESCSAIRLDIFFHGFPLLLLLFFCALSGMCES